MQLQYEISQNRKSSIAIVTDSVADLSADFILENQIFVLPLNVSVGEQAFLDKLTINPQIFSEKYNQEFKNDNFFNQAFNLLIHFSPF